MKICILATGPSMSQGLADSLRAEHCIVVNNAFELAPWAAALCAQDHAWWRQYPHAHQFAGRKFSANKIDGVEQVLNSNHVQRGSSSGVLALEVARRIGEEIGIKEVELHGYDNRGAHYFGLHKPPLSNPRPDRFNFFAQQLASLGRCMEKEGFRIVNRTPNSALRCFEVN